LASAMSLSKSFVRISGLGILFEDFLEATHSLSMIPGPRAFVELWGAPLRTGWVLLPHDVWLKEQAVASALSR
jgi:hypothetical protein